MGKKVSLPNKDYDEADQDLATGFLVMKKNDVEMYKSWVKEKIKTWHDLNPDLVILSDSGAVPIGFALKEAYSLAYGKEKTPKFYRYAPHLSRNIPMHWRTGAPESLPIEDLEARQVKRRESKILNSDDSKMALKMQAELKKFIGTGARVITYDETSSIRGMDQNKDRLIQVIASGVDLVPELAADKTLYDAPEGWGQGNHGLYLLVSTMFNKGSVWIDSGQPENPQKFESSRSIVNTSYYHQVANYIGKARYENPITKGNGPKKDPEQKQRAMAFIHDLKVLGKQAGEEVFERSL